MRLPIKFLSILCLLSGLQAIAQGQAVIDDLNRTVTLTSPAERIISLSPHLSELVFTAGAGKKLVGVSRHCDYPQAVLELPPVSDYQNINFEKIALLQSDLILVWNAGLKQKNLELLKRLTKQVYVSDPKTPQNIADNLIDIGILAGSADIARQHAASYLTEIKTLEQRYHQTQPISVMYLTWHEPPMTINGDHWISQFIHLCGGENPYADAPMEIIRLNKESMLLNQAQLVLHSMAEKNFNLPRSLPTAYIPDDFIQRPTLRSIEGIKAICTIIDRYATNLKN